MSATPVPVGALIFADEFDGTQVDTTKWNAHSGHAGNGLGYWNGLHNVKLDGNSNLEITAVKNGSVWDSAFLTSKPGWSGKRYLETRAKVAAGVGTWNGPWWEWAYPYGAAPGIEIDVVEQLGRRPTANHFAAHSFTTGGSEKTLDRWYDSKVPLAAAFHVYGAAVYTDRIDYYLDGQKVQTAAAVDLSVASLTTFKMSGCVQLNMGGWAGTPTSSSPAVLLVDYVRCYSLP